ncbi:hypothetical protein B0E37_06224 [Streptomyces sp. MH192]|nr:hypothetical protein [Streptomyces sp. MH192]MCF0103637.1 hypothetical protein [Streptomyces sp. MH191]
MVQRHLREVRRPDGRPLRGHRVRRAQPRGAGGQFPQPGQVPGLLGGQHHAGDDAPRRGRPREVRLVVRRQVRPGERPPRAPVGGVPQAQLPRVHPHLVLQELGARLPCEPFLPGAQQDVVRLPGRLRAGPPVVDARAVQRDRQPVGGAAHVPDVDPVGDEGETRSGRQDARGEDEVLVGEAALGEADAVRAQEAGPVQLVDAQGVVHQPAAGGGPFDHRRARVQLRLPGGLAPRGHLTAHAQPGGDLGPVAPGRAQQGVDGAWRQDVVAVQEHQVGGGRRVDAVVARGAAAPAVDRAADHPQARLPGGECRQQAGAAVR